MLNVSFDYPWIGLMAQPPLPEGLDKESFEFDDREIVGQLD